MLTQLALRNFQSWKELDLELGPITVIVGSGDKGKSAIMRAIKYALTNKGGDGFIRHGEDEAVVGLAFDDGTQLVWTKKRGKGGEYLLNEREFSKTGTTVPKEIADAIGIRGVEIDKATTIFPQIHGQFDSPFLVKASGTQRARILGKLTKLDVLVTAQMNAKRDLDRSHKQIDGLEEGMDRLRASIDALPNILYAKEQLEELERLIHLLERSRQASLTQAALRNNAVAQTKLALVRDAVSEMEVRVEHYEMARQGVERWRKVVSQYADATFALDQAKEEYEDRKAAYGDAIGEQELCDRCPLRHID